MKEVFDRLDKIDDKLGKIDEIDGRLDRVDDKLAKLVDVAEATDRRLTDLVAEGQMRRFVDS